jgi:hypothetical protein
MPEFEIESKLKIKVDMLATDLFSMEAVNHELSPIVRMSVPLEWRSVPINQWPCGEFLFNSWITLFGVLPIDLHRFQLSEVGSTSMKETSSSLMNKHWNHQRTIKRVGNGSVVCDRVQYTSRLRPLGYLLLPVFKLVFRHRHRYLKSKYGESN